MTAAAATRVIDADCHVIETPRTFDHMREEDAKLKPLVLMREDGANDDKYWFLEGRAWRMNQNVGPEFPTAAREAADIQARLAHMDELGVDVHILYPTMFLRPLTRHADTDYALSRAYNRWLADVWAQGGGRLRWAVIPPLTSMDKAIEEINVGKEHGACAVFFRGHEQGMLLSDSYFHPVYEEAQRLDMPIAVHAAVGDFAAMDLNYRSFGLPTFKFPTVGAFSDLVLHKTPEKFPDLRWAFIEVTSQWLPYVLNDLVLRNRKLVPGSYPRDAQLMEEYRLYVGCQTIDDLAYVVDRVGDDHLVIGTDYGHADTTAEMNALSKVRDEGKASEASLRKFLYDNPKRLYGL